MFFSWIRKLMQLPAWTEKRPKLSAKSNARTRLRLCVDALEDRTVPAFLGPTSITTGTNPGGIAVADYNGDGKGDMAVVNTAATGTISVLMSNGDGSFQPKVDYAAGLYPADAAAGDFNGDGKMDLAVGGSDLSVMLNTGDGTFAPPTVLAPAINSHSIKVGDFNNDGQADIATMNYGTASVLLGNGDGTFQTRSDAAFPGNTNMIVGDFNRDGNLDMATSNTVSSGTITVLNGRGDGSFAPAQSVYAYSAPVYLASGDFNHDGYDDFAVANSYAATSMSIVLNNGDGSYAAPATYNIPQTGYEIEVADFNNDGNDDYAVRGASSYMVGFGKGDGNFYAPVSFSTNVGKFEAGTHGDFNGDGAIDFAYPSTGGVTVVMNANDNVASLAGAVGFQISVPPSTTSGSALPVTITAVDANGAPVSGFRGSVYITTSDPASKSSATYTFTATDAGTHTFTGSIRLVTIGSQTVTVSSPLMTSASSTVTVNPGVSHFGVSAPTASVAGDTFNVTVTALDALGNVGTGYTSTVHFATADINAGLPADYTFTPEDAGAHTFAVTLKTAGASRYLSVTETGSAISGGAFINVTPQAASSIVLAGAGGAIGVARPITLVARDVYGNVATSYGGTVHFTSSDPRAVLPSDATFVNGTATVSVTLLTVGTQTITATDVASGLSGTMSSDATPPVAALFAVSGFPATTAGVAQSFTVTVRDTIGQIATGFVGTIYFSSSDRQAGLPASYTFTAADAGVHTFSATLKTAGAQSISVRDINGALSGSQMGIAVTSAAFSSYRLTVPNPSDSKGHILVTAGESISLTVRATDVYGNTVTGYKGKAKFSSTDTLAALPTDYSFTAADAGVHTFTVALKTATPNGVVWSFNVVDASNAATLATITNFEVTNAAAAKFVLNVPSNITAGKPFSLKVTVLDAYGNRVKNYFGTIHFGNTAGIAGLPADYNFTSIDSGVASFTVTLNTTGNQTLSVVDLADAALQTSTVVSVKAGTTTTTGGSGGGGGGGGGGSGGGKKL